MYKVGVDIVENSRINLKSNFLAKFLHPQEIMILNNLESEQAKIQFAAGRWAVKEALVKCVEQKVYFNKVNIIYQNNKPKIENQEFQNIEISISHERNYTVAVAFKF